MKMGLNFKSNKQIQRLFDHLIFVDQKETFGPACHCHFAMCALTHLFLKLLPVFFPLL